MTRLLITRGLPASGKTTFARKLQPDVVRVNRDDLRRMLHGQRLFTQWAEAQVTHAQRAAVEALLRARADVIVDDTNLRGQDGPGVGRDGRPVRRDVRGARLHRRAAGGVPAAGRRPAGGRAGRRGRRSAGCTTATWPGRTCRCRCRSSTRAARAWSTRPDPELPPVVLVDIDGTVALMAGPQPVRLEPGRRGRPEPGGDRRGPGDARGRARDRVLLRPGRGRAGRRREAWLDLYVGVPYEGAVHAAGGRHPQGLRSSSGRSSTRRSGTAGGSSGFSTTASRWYACGVRWA